MTPSAEIEPGPHWWKATALTTRPTLPALNSLLSCERMKTIKIILKYKQGCTRPFFTYKPVAYLVSVVRLGRVGKVKWAYDLFNSCFVTAQARLPI